MSFTIRIDLQRCPPIVLNIRLVGYSNDFLSIVNLDLACRYLSVCNVKFFQWWLYKQQYHITFFLYKLWRNRDDLLSIHVFENPRFALVILDIT